MASAHSRAPGDASRQALLLRGRRGALRRRRAASWRCSRRPASTVTRVRSVVTDASAPTRRSGRGSPDVRHAFRPGSAASRLAVVAVRLAAVALASPARAQNLASFEQRTTVHVLPNGWTFIICERPGAPVFSFATQADVGAAQDPKGQTGMAHMFEHMAFKGTPVIGTTDYAKEKPALEAMEAAYQAWQKAKDARKPDPKELERLAEGLRGQAGRRPEVRQAERVRRAVSREGGVGLNAGTSSDAPPTTTRCPPTSSSCSPTSSPSASRSRCFASSTRSATSSSRSGGMRTESQPTGRLVEKFIGAAFTAHPYHNPPIGYCERSRSATR